MFVLASSVYSTEHPSAFTLLLLHASDHPACRAALRYVACHHWPACRLDPAYLAELVRSAETHVGLMWALHAGQVRETPVIWDEVVQRLARRACFEMLATATAQAHRGVGALYLAELHAAAQDDERLSRALLLCAAHQPPVDVPASLLAALLKRRRCVPPALAMAGKIRVDADLAHELLQCPEATERTFRPLLSQAVFRQAVRALPLARLMQLPTLCYAASDLMVLPKHALLELVDAYAQVPTVVRGQQHLWNMVCMRHNMRQRARGGSLDWTSSPLATLYYMDHTGTFPSGPLARYRMLQVHRQYREESRTLCMDVATYLLRLAMRDRRGATMACKGCAWQHMPLPQVLVELVIAFT
jgi:hypothetical protein